MNEKRKQGILLLFPLVILLLGTGFTSVLFYHVYQQTAYEHISAFCEIILENTPEAEPQLLSALKTFALTDQEVTENHHLENTDTAQMNFAKTFHSIFSFFLFFCFLRLPVPLLS